ncbi:ABC transporter ATP-binding protein [Fibrobacterota bacterium]
MSNQSLISLKSIHKSFKDVGTRVEVLKNLDFEVFEGQFLAIRGASGVGKSTLLHIMGFLDTPTSGQMFFAGEDVTSLSDTKLSGVRNREVGFVFQFHHLLPDFTAWENVLMPITISGNVSRQDETYGQELISLVQMEHRLKHLPSELSGGERQRLALVRALIHKPRLLLADEPSGNLDETNKESLHKLLSDFHKNLGITIVLVTHDSGLASLAENQYVLHDGKINMES